MKPQITFSVFGALALGAAGPNSTHTNVIYWVLRTTGQRHRSANHRPWGVQLLTFTVPPERDFGTRPGLIPRSPRTTERGTP